MEKKLEFTCAIIEKKTSEIVDADGITLGLVRFNRDGSVSLNWITELFDPKSPMFAPVSLRAMLVKQLRRHADALESGELDAMVKKTTEES